jgi:hypothetical protein
MTSMHSKVASAGKDGDQYHLVADLVLVPSEFRAIRRLQFKRERRSQDRKKPEISRCTLVAWVNHNLKGASY